MSRIRKALYAACMTAALGYAAAVLLADVIPDKPDRFTSAHSLGVLPPMMGFAADSVFNVGSAEELDKFPNIGSVLSQRIVDYRELWGDYRIPEDLTLVKGIGEKTMNAILEALEEPLVPKYPGE